MGAVEVLDAGEFGRASECAIEAISPAVIWTSEILSVAAGGGANGRCVMAADVEKRA